jgi:hypothetical protein
MLPRQTNKIDGLLLLFNILNHFSAQRKASKTVPCRIDTTGMVAQRPDPAGCLADNQPS